MKLSCLLSLILYAAFVIGYHQWLAQTWDPPAVWIVSCIVALIALGGLGAIYNSFLLWRDASVLGDALVDMPRRDGKRTAAAGKLEPAGQPLVAPLSGQPCVLYEYEIVRHVTRSSDDGDKTSRTVDFSGIGKAECVIRSTSTNLRLLGFPDLEHVPEQFLDTLADEQRALQYVQFTAWEDVSGLSLLHGARDMWNALTGSEESLRKDWRMIAVKDCAWLAAAAEKSPAATSSAPGTLAAAGGNVDASAAAEDDLEEDLVEDELDDEENDDDDTPQTSYHPQLVEKRIAPGQQVVAIGRYDEVRQGLAGSGAQTIRIYLEDVPSVARKLGGSKWRHLIGGIITLVIVNAGLYGAQWIYRHNDKTQSQWRDQLEKAVRNGDLKGAKKVLDRGANVNAAGRAGDKPLLLETKDAAMAKLLLARGADVNATDGDGRTALMVAAHEGRPDMLRVLIDAGAKLDLKNKVYNTTALMMAIDAEKSECIDILREAGAKDDTITEKDGQPITEEHEAFGVCREYLAAVFAADPTKLRELSSRDQPARFDDVEWPIWQESRPKEPRLLAGFVRGDDATVTVTGPNPKGSDRTWVYQLRREDGKWHVVRERWVVEGVP